MTESRLSYEILYEILRREKARQDLQKLDKTFYLDFENYIKEKMNILELQKQKSSIFAQKEIEKTEKQIDNIRKIIKELYEKRELKITQLALSVVKTKMQDLPELLPEEKLMFDKLVEVLKNFRWEIINNILEDKPKVIKSDQETKLIRFIQAVPKFVGDDSNEYGPFEEEYVALLPIKIAELLIKNNRAELI